MEWARLVMDWLQSQADLMGTLGTGLALMAAVVAAFVNAGARKFTKEDEDGSIEIRVKRLSNALGDSIRLIKEIEQEIESRHALASKLQEDVQRYEALQDSNAAQVEAIAQVLRGELQSQGQKSFMRSTIVSVTLFLAGAGVSFGLTFLLG